MTTPKVPTVQRGNSRFYIHPVTGEKCPGVTSIVDMLPKPFLKAWAAKLVAETAVEKRSSWLPMAEEDPAGAVDYLKGAPYRSMRSATDTGSAAHGIFEALSLGRPLGRVTEQLEPFARHFEHFLETVEPEYVHVEQTVWSQTHGYAGTFDAAARIDGHGCWIDYKTNAKGIHAEVALQLAAYSRADFLLSDEGEQTAMPAGFDRGVVLWMRPEGWKLYELPIDDEVFSIFLALRRTFTWDSVLSKGIIKKPLLAGGAPGWVA